VKWLIGSIAVCDGRGSSKAYRLFNGWMTAYPETSGYIIPTLLELDRTGLLADGRRKAEEIAAWLVELQDGNGGYRGGEIGRSGGFDVFDTGMILLGFTALMKEGGGELDVTQPAGRAAQFLMRSLDETGCFVRHVHHDIVHAYNVRAAWALVAYGKLAGKEEFVVGGLANARWTAAQQNASGLYRNNGFWRGGHANTHSIAYVLQGLLQIFKLTEERPLLDSALAAAKQLATLYDREGWLAGDIADDGTYRSRHVCLTGYAQLALVYDDLTRVTGDHSWRLTGQGLLEQVAATQELGDPSAPWYGGIAGSFPIYGRYAPLQYPNWATKFFIDALLSRRQLEAGHVDRLWLAYGG
jgi:hypothetical protein